MKKSTLAVHAGARRKGHVGGLNTPVDASSAVRYLDDSEVRYPRYFNQLNHQVVADKIAALEGAEAGLVTSSGMAAISAILLGLVDPGDHVLLLEGIYGGTDSLVRNELERFGIAHDFVAGDVDAFRDALRPATRLLFVESPTNPLLDIVDLAALAALAEQHDILTAIDNTFATPILQNPIALGFDIVMHSGTKFLGGHSDLCCGALAASSELIGRLRDHQVMHGGSLNAQDCALLERSLKTLDLRVRQQSSNAGRIAEALDGHPALAEVRYPGLAEDPGHALAGQQMSDYGALVTLRLRSDVDPVAVLRRLSLVTPAVSLGGVETTICQSVMTSHAKMSPAERERLGITPQVLRISVGIEDAADVIDDLSQALDGA